ncbi:hypothetical protein J4050_12070 [Winogradskyella sp. DF17]|uniref:Uncharacterized protein n=1 Tax=Winogradskyella pelagia TaxID=2819984 RepID=A0ABS3T6Y8_9FLAO|nr:hypothetical protein [Winogradskyella sp. DF17]MBO3117490.1 hypothetical protein [Winogradskyella sp. DF17]
MNNVYYADKKIDIVILGGMGKGIENHYNNFHSMTLRQGIQLTIHHRFTKISKQEGSVSYLKAKHIGSPSFRV